MRVVVHDMLGQTMLQLMWNIISHIFFGIFFIVMHMHMHMLQLDFGFVGTTKWERKYARRRIKGDRMRRRRIEEKPRLKHSHRLDGIPLQIGEHLHFVDRIFSQQYIMPVYLTGRHNFAAVQGEIWLMFNI